MKLRSAHKEDAPALALLIDIAGEGLPTWLWARSAADGQSPHEVGALRAAREEGSFSYRNAWAAEHDGRIAGMLLGYRQPDLYEAGDLTQFPEPIRPLIELEAQAPGSWYVNALAVFPEFRRQGIATRLLTKADALALVSGAATLSVIVAEENERALALYRRSGFAPAARRRIVPWAEKALGGDWLLMLKAAC